MANPPSANSPVHGKRFLVVEDEFLIQLDIQHILEGAGARSVITASRLTDALTAIDAGERFDAAVLDLMLEKESALPVAKRLTVIGVPFIYLTGVPDGAEHAYPAPVVGKPFDSAALVAALVMVLAKRG